MKKKLLKILLFIAIITITVIYTYKIRLIVDDEFFNYGFAKNILDGLIPYKDFNMIIPPLFAYITALVLKIFKESLLVYHIFTAIIIFGITYLSSKKIGKKSIIIYLLLLIYPYTGYNMFSLFLLFILLTLKEDQKYYKYLEPIIISLMIFTKHTLGLLIIPSLYYSKNRLQTFLIYVASFLILVLYLLLNNNLFEFIDYTILGMFDFTNRNNTGINFLFIIELFIIGVLAYKVKKTNKKEYFYTLMYQIVTFPIVNYIHFIISFIPVVYLLIYEYRKNNYVVWFTIISLVSFFLSFNFIFYHGSTKINVQSYEKDTFMKGRQIQTIVANRIELIDEYINEYPEYTPYIFTNLAYQAKLNSDYPINKYDLINNGNMGYHGSKKYIQEIDEYCQKHKCLLIINELEINDNNNIQTNQEILKHYTNNKNYKKIYNSTMINIYKN